VRALHPEGVPRVLVGDTVGFIKNLPHVLVASFKSGFQPRCSLVSNRGYLGQDRPIDSAVWAAFERQMSTEPERGQMQL
jgi:hypothetical protein